MEKSEISRFMACKPVCYNIYPESILAENYIVTHEIHRFAIMRSA